MKREFPQSTMMSPASMRAASCSMTASVAAPAWTMMMATRGRSRERMKSSMSREGTKTPSEPSPWAAMRRSVRVGVRLNTAVRYPLRARLRARFDPMTPSP